MNKIETFFNGKIDIFSRGSFQFLTFLLLFSIAFTSMYSEKVLLYLIFVLIITINNVAVEYVLIKKYGPEPRRYMKKFLIICLPFSIMVLSLFVYLV